ncbi:hypothetical protein F5883DRAFT_437689 [Diaporthe sp. PMI_573]|nr:hypothetical protein F5883DRAFT_437689 [Diaporthaceae sp. PMI_573]
MRQSVLTRVLGLTAAAQATTVFQRRNETFDVPEVELGRFTTGMFASKSDALSGLASVIGAEKVAYSGDKKYGAAVARVWTQQLKTYPEAILYPTSVDDVSAIMQFYSAAHDLWGNDGFAFMAGGHADFGGAQSPSVIVDLYGMGETEFATDPTGVATNDSSQWPILKVGGGADGAGPPTALAGTGWAFMGPRGATIGVGGFVLGGGICWQTSRYGMAADNLVGIEMVLLNGTVVYANPHNEYSDLFWASTGAGWIGLGVVTHFYSQTYPDPGTIYSATMTWTEENAAQAFEKTAEFFSTNTNPDAAPSLMYFYKDPAAPTALKPIGSRQFVVQMNAMLFGGDMATFNQTYGQFYNTNTSTITIQTWTLKTIQQFLLPSYPLGFQRMYYGKSHTSSTADFYSQTFLIYKQTVEGMIARGEDVGHTLWADQYIMPGTNGNAPASDSDTAWPHSTTAHLTVTSGEWSNSSTTAFIKGQDENFMMPYLRTFQEGLNQPSIYDYPNFIKVSEIWGQANYNRLVEIKQKYDPDCLLNRGRVFDTTSCKAKNLSNTSL